MACYDCSIDICALVLWTGTCMVLLCVRIIHPHYFHNCFQAWVQHHRIWWTPDPLPVNAAPALFSEARALQHVKVLSHDIVQRQVTVHS
jgi:hypothetical protein